MRLSPWEASRFRWAAIESVVGLTPERETVTLEPRLPPNWHWLRVHDLPYRGHRLCFFLARQADVLRVHALDVGADLRRAAIRLEAHGCALYRCPWTM